ncbi:MAG: hypothetical protein ABJE66_33010, partial [Deltaproteobacteria bacterium]
MAKDLWTHKGSKFVIGTLHGDKIEITAQYNPKELARQAAASWSAHPNTAARHSKTSENHLWMEFGNSEPRTATVELTFDGYEEGEPITKHVEDLERLTLPVDMNSKIVSKRRPQLCVAVWGNQTMRCVVTAVATKLTMFATDGSPLRATCTVTLKEVDVVAMMAADRDGTNVDAYQSGYASDSRTSRQMPYPPEDSKPTRVPPPNRSESSPPATAKPAPANTVGTPSAKINPAALEGAQSGTGPLFADQAPAAAPASTQAPANTVGTPSAQVDPNAMDGEGDHVFVGDQPAPQTGTPSAQVDPNAM